MMQMSLFDLERRTRVKVLESFSMFSGVSFRYLEPLRSSREKLHPVLCGLCPADASLLK